MWKVSPSKWFLMVGVYLVICDNVFMILFIEFDSYFLKKFIVHSYVCLPCLILIDKRAFIPALL